MNLINYSAEPQNVLYSWLPRGLKADTVIFFPDACPSHSLLPTGTVVQTRQPDWRRFAVSDCGCGMLLAKSSVQAKDFDRAAWDNVYLELRANKGRIGDLGSGNHFLDALRTNKTGCIYFLIHTGSRAESGLVEHLIDKPSKFDTEFGRVTEWARQNRMAIARMVEEHFGNLEIILDRTHNHFEVLNDRSIIIRKGAVRLLPGEETVIPSNMDGAVALVRATDKAADVLNSMCHGTGRVMSRSEAKEHAARYDYSALRQRIYITDAISDASIRTEAPFCYRDLDLCLELLDGLVTVEDRLFPFAYLGQI